MKAPIAVSHARANAMRHTHPVNAMALHFAILILASLLLFSHGYATQGTPEQMARLKSLYADLMLDPTQLDKTLEYARLATEMGDYETAIPPLERLLLTYPNSAKLQLELGTLYYLLGAKSIAQGYFDDVTANAKADDEYRKQAEAYLTKL